LRFARKTAAPTHTPSRLRPGSSTRTRTARARTTSHPESTAASRAALRPPLRPARQLVGCWLRVALGARLAHVLCADLDVERVARGVLVVEVAHDRPLGALEAELEAALDADRPDARGQFAQVGAQRLARLLAQLVGVVLAELGARPAEALVELRSAEVVGVLRPRGSRRTAGR
jgi:hypothetical protein